MSSQKSINLYIHYRYRIKPSEAYPLCAFLLPCLNQLPEFRSNASEILIRELTKSPDLKGCKRFIALHYQLANFKHNIPSSGWFNMDTTDDHRMNEAEFKLYMQNKQTGNDDESAVVINNAEGL